ncbi:MAG: sel1 repeat family protein [Firmicutes bacterium]|nr:sel1 repeat family protein [Bacillota bacterium]
MALIKCPECEKMISEYAKECIGCGYPMSSIIKEKNAQENAEALYELGEEHYDKKNYSKAVEFFAKAANLGDADAQYSLGFCYYHGEGVEEDEEEAFKWFLNSAKQNHASSQYYVGECYLHGWGIIEDEVEAVEWFKKSAMQGDEEAQYFLGFCYETGKGITKDHIKAIEWYTKATNNENAKKRLIDLINKIEQEKKEVEEKVKELQKKLKFEREAKESKVFEYDFAENFEYKEFNDKIVITKYKNLNNPFIYIPAHYKDKKVIVSNLLFNHFKENFFEEVENAFLEDNCYEINDELVACDSEKFGYINYLSEKDFNFEKNEFTYYTIICEKSYVGDFEGNWNVVNCKEYTGFPEYLFERFDGYEPYSIDFEQARGETTELRIPYLICKGMYENDNYVYAINENDEILIIKFKEKDFDYKIITIPESIQGKKLCKISNGAFSACSQLTVRVVYIINTDFDISNSLLSFHDEYFAKKGYPTICLKSKTANPEWGNWHCWYSKIFYNVQDIQQKKDDFYLTIDNETRLLEELLEESEKEHASANARKCYDFSKDSDYEDYNYEDDYDYYEKEDNSIDYGYGEDIRDDEDW